MVYFGVDLYRFSLICNDCFRKVVYKKEKGDEQIVLTPSISESNIKFLKISSLFPTVSISMYWMSRLKRWPTPLCRRTNRLQYIVVVVSVVKRPLPY